MDAGIKGKSTTGKKSSKTKTMLITVFLIMIFSCAFIFTIAELAGYSNGLIESAALLSAKLSLPQGGEEYLTQQMQSIENVLSKTRTESESAAQSKKSPSGGSSAASSSAVSSAEGSSSNSSAAASSD